MLERPKIEDERIIACLKSDYGLGVSEIAFLPLGADLNTAVFRVVANDGIDYFLKLRRGEFSEASVAVPNYLYELGIEQIIPPIATQTGELWATLTSFKVILYPYVEGKHGFERSLSEQQWNKFGVALKQFHSADIPVAITTGVAREAFSSTWRDSVKLSLARTKEALWDEPIAAEMATFLNAKEAEALALVARAERLAEMLKLQPPEFILCHADIHAWNLLVADDGRFYMVDWDTLIFAPKERDLMFIGGGLGGKQLTPREEEARFYRGYGQAQINPVALAYYRYERIIEDIAVYCEQILLSNEGGEDRKRSFESLKSNFLPGGLIEMAWHADKSWRSDNR